MRSILVLVASIAMLSAACGQPSDVAITKPEQRPDSRINPYIAQPPTTTTTTTTEPPAPTPVRAAAATPAPPPQPVTVTPPRDMREAILACIRSYEGAYTTNTGNGYYGAYQFDLDTWGGQPDPDGIRRGGAVARAGHPYWSNHLPSGAPPHVQDDAAWQLYQERDLQPWPTPNRHCHPPNPRPKGG